MLLFFVRHGDPIYTPDDLTPLGKRQAEAIGKRLALYGVDKIFSSTSNRAIQTAVPVSEMLNKEIVQLDFCNEGYAVQEFGVHTDENQYVWAFAYSKLRALFADRTLYAKEAWYEDERLPKNNFKAGVERVNKCVDEWLLSLGYEHDRTIGVYKAVAPTQERVALFAHQGFGLAFLSSLLDIPYPLFCTHFDIGHSDLTAVEFSEEKGIVVPKVLTHSNDGHLYREGLSTKYNYNFTF